MNDYSSSRSVAFRSFGSAQAHGAARRSATFAVKRRHRAMKVALVDCPSLLIVYEHQAWFSPTVLIIYDN